MTHAVCERVPTVPGTEIQDLFLRVGWLATPVSVGEPASGANSGPTPEQFATPDRLQRVFEASAAIYAARKDGTLIGLARVVSDHVRESVVYDLVVAPEHRHRGVGAMLLERCLRDFRHTAIALAASADTLEFYRKFGFERLERYPDLLILRRG
jgi:ribosomal protein S18 acetylase RimI-like enzyme